MNIDLLKMIQAGGRNPGRQTGRIWFSTVRSDEAPGSAGNQNEASSLMAFRCLPMLDWPSNLFA